MIVAAIAPLTPTGTLAVNRGDTNQFYLTFTNDGDNSAVDLTGAKIWLTGKRNLSDPDTAAVIQRTSDTGGGILVASPQTGQATITLDPSQTATLTRAESLFYDVQLKTFAGLVFTVLSGFVDVTLDVTRGTL